jgi:acetyltransferase-like isoleucine patch superfamily enzyme
LAGIVEVDRMLNIAGRAVRAVNRSCQILLTALRIYYLRIFYNINLHGSHYIALSAKIEVLYYGNRAGGSIVAGRGLQLSEGAILSPFSGQIVLGLNVFLGPYVVVYGHGGVEIGDQTLISMHCRILSSNHTIPPVGVDIRSQPDVLLPTRIGRDVWLGAGVTVLGGVSIGDGCIVGAGSVVSKDLPPNAVAFGLPATVRYFRAGLTPDATGG